MRIGIDARFFGAQRQGLGRYTSELVHQIAKNPDGNSYVVFVSYEAQASIRVSHVSFVRTHIPWYGFREQWQWPLLLRRHKLDLMHFTHFNVPFLYRRPFIVTIHDLILMHEASAAVTTRHPFYFKFKYYMYKKVLQSALRRALHIITISKYSKDDIERFFPFVSDKISVIYEGVFATDKQSEVVTSERGVSYAFQGKPFFLYVGNAYPHKNLEFLILCFQELRLQHHDYHLVLVGRQDEFYKRLMEALPSEIKTYVHAVGAIDDKTLEILYKTASAYVFPSRYEGFGLPGLEAMHYDLPVLASDRTAIPEILGDAALYASPENKKDFVKKMIDIVDNTELRERLRTRGAAHYKKFSWERMAREHQKLYSSLKN